MSTCMDVQIYFHWLKTGQMQKTYKIYIYKKEISGECSRDSKVIFSPDPSTATVQHEDFHQIVDYSTL